MLRIFAAAVFVFIVLSFPFLFRALIKLFSLNCVARGAQSELQRFARNALHEGTNRPAEAILEWTA